MFHAGQKAVSKQNFTVAFVLCSLLQVKFPSFFFLGDHLFSVEYVVGCRLGTSLQRFTVGLT